MILVQQILAGQLSRQAAARQCGVSNTAVRRWVQLYNAEGEAGLCPRTQNHHLTAEQKQAAVQEYLAGGGSLAQICQKYGIRSTQHLQNMVDCARAGRPQRGYCGASRHKGGAYTTAEQRVQIVRECLDNDCDYGAIALKYNVRYSSLVYWVQCYCRGGPRALHDTRHAAGGISRVKGNNPPTAPLLRLTIVLYCLQNQKNYGAASQKYKVSYHQVYSWVQRYAKDGWVGLSARRGPLREPPAPDWKKIAPKTEPAAEHWLRTHPDVPPELPELLHATGCTWQACARIVYQIARMDG